MVRILRHPSPFLSFTVDIYTIKPESFEVFAKWVAFILTIERVIEHFTSLCLDVSVVGFKV